MRHNHSIDKVASSQCTCMQAWTIHSNAYTHARTYTHIVHRQSENVGKWKSRMMMMVMWNFWWVTCTLQTQTHINIEPNLSKRKMKRDEKGKILKMRCESVAHHTERNAQSENICVCADWGLVHTHSNTQHTNQHTSSAVFVHACVRACVSHIRMYLWNCVWIGNFSAMSQKHRTRSLSLCVNLNIYCKVANDMHTREFEMKMSIEYPYKRRRLRPRFLWIEREG